MEDNDKDQQEQLTADSDQRSADSEELTVADQPESPEDTTREEQTQPADGSDQLTADNEKLITEDQEQLEADSDQQTADSEELTVSDQPESPEDTDREEQRTADSDQRTADSEELIAEGEEQVADPSTGSPRPGSEQAGQAADSEELTVSDQPESPEDTDREEQAAPDEATPEEAAPDSTEPGESAAASKPEPGIDVQDEGEQATDDPSTGSGQAAGSEELIVADQPESSEQAGDTESSEHGNGCCGGSSDTAGDPSDPDSVRTALISIRGQNRTAHFSAGDHSLSPGDEVVIQTEQGKSIGVVMEPPVTLSCRGCKTLKILRKASPEEIAQDEENRELEKKAFEYCSNTIEEWEIAMRLVQVEFLLDRSKAIFFFTAEKRVDFRELVRTLAREFSTRIEMRQIGIRDEARLLGGIGPCGMAFCCSTFLKEFAPISVKMAKEQNVILNPNKISGGCGRLLCCLNYEYDMYKEASKGVPKVGKKVNLPEGAGKVRSVDIFARTVTIDLPEEKKNIVMDIDELLEKMK